MRETFFCVRPFCGWSVHGPRSHLLATTLLRRILRLARTGDKRLGVVSHQTLACSFGGRTLSGC